MRLQHTVEYTHVVQYTVVAYSVVYIDLESSLTVPYAYSTVQHFKFILFNCIVEYSIVYRIGMYVTVESPLLLHFHRSDILYYHLYCTVLYHSMLSPSLSLVNLCSTLNESIHPFNLNAQSPLISISISSDSYVIMIQSSIRLESTLLLLDSM